MIEDSDAYTANTLRYEAKEGHVRLKKLGVRRVFVTGDNAMADELISAEQGTEKSIQTSSQHKK